MDDRPTRAPPPSRRQEPGTPAIARAVLLVACLDGLSGTALSALASHLPDRAFIPGGRDIAWHAIWMQMWHAPVLLALGIAMMIDRRFDRPGCRLAVAGLAAGLMLFCGGVYDIAFGDGRLGAIAPTGGVLVMGAWVAVGVSLWRVRA